MIIYNTVLEPTLEGHCFCGYQWPNHKNFILIKPRNVEYVEFAKYKPLENLLKYLSTFSENSRGFLKSDLVMSLLLEGWGF